MKEPITTDERYSSAAHSSNLRVEADKRGDADVMIAAGWSPSRVGAALLRLHSEWDGLAKPRKLSQEAIKRYALTLSGKPEDKEAKAQRIAHDWYMHEAGLMLSQLKSLSSVRGQLVIKAEKWNVEDALDVVSAVLLWWLDPVCGVCHGQERKQIPGTPVLSDVACPSCRGSGKRQLPKGRDGREIDRFIADCLDQARVSIGKRLRNS